MYLSHGFVRTFRATFNFLFGTALNMADAPVEASPVSLGPNASGATAFRSFRPTVLQIADRINDDLTLKTPVGSALPLPAGMFLRVCDANKKVQLVLDSRAFSLRMRKVFGFAGSIEMGGNRKERRLWPSSPNFSPPSILPAFHFFSAFSPTNSYFGKEGS